jgi:sigma 54 modulation/S30EA-like ribosomal protein
MRIQVNSDATVKGDLRVVSFVRHEIDRILARFTDRLTRVEVHLSDLNAAKSGAADKRCVVEARPTQTRPLTTTATARRLDAAIGQALRKMQRLLASFYGRRAAVGPRPARRQAAAKAPATGSAKAAEKPAAKRAARPAAQAKAAASPRAAEPAASARGAKKLPIHQGRRKAWPTR